MSNEMKMRESMGSIRNLDYVLRTKINEAFTVNVRVRDAARTMSNEDRNRVLSGLMRVVTR